ncbi:MAG: hypothetical protein HYX78_05605 [Armatimonadetes bacterium]|nr:hypothetical protein [Armatimonadota bacterium]
MSVSRSVVLSSICACLLSCGQCNGVATLTHHICRAGQVFLAWSDDSPPRHYRVYCSESPIIDSSFGEAILVADEVLPGSAKDLIETQRALSKGQADPDVGYSLTNLGPRLDPTGSLWVHTVSEERQRYYAVTRVQSDGDEDRTLVLGTNSLTQPIAETIGQPEPVVDSESVTPIWGNICTTFLHWATPDQSLADGSPFKFILEQPAQSSTLPMTIVLHGYSRILDDPSEQRWRFVLSLSDWHPFLPHGGYDWWFGYARDYESGAIEGPVVNYTEKRLLWTINWIMTNFPVDKEQILLTGFSMGASGALTFGIRHPELFAAIEALCPNISPGLPGIGWTQDQLVSIWGPVEGDVLTSEGVSPWERQDCTNYVRNCKSDLPFIKVNNNRNDTVLPWFQSPPFYKALNDGRHGCWIGWGNNGHTVSTSGYPEEFIEKKARDIRKDRPFLAFTNASSDDEPGAGDPSDGDPVGQMGCEFVWELVRDTQESFAFRARCQSGSSNVDVTPRRKQQFAPNSGTDLVYMVTDELDNVISEGRVKVGDVSVFTLEQVQLADDWRTVYIYNCKETSVSDLSTLPSGAHVLMPQLVVTAVLADRFYAELRDRSGAIEVMSNELPEVADIVRVFGVKTNNKTLQAVDILQVGRDVPINPIGCRIIDLADDSKLQNCLVVACGNVGAGIDGTFITDGSGTCELTGDIPGYDGFALVRGICTSFNGRARVLVLWSERASD